MNRISNIFKKFLLSIIFIMMLLPMIQNEFNFIEIEPLKGYIVFPEDATINKTNWFTGEYQENKETYINSMFGFRSLFVRINNQICYSIFNKATANGVIIGKENYLFEENYIYAYTGKDYLGEDSITHTLNRLKFISDTLDKLNKQLIIVFAAGKASYYPEYIPDNYLTKKNKTNYESMSFGANKLGLHTIDFNKWFIDNKSTSKYPLFPKHGIHWSSYGTALVADSILKMIGSLRNIELPNIYFDTVFVEKPKDSDYDLADGMNLMFRLKSFDLGYPQLKVGKLEGKIKPKVLVISDSFYWGMYNFGISNCFTNDHFWYYNKQVYPESATKEVLVENLNLKTEVENHDVFIIMATEGTLNNISWGFAENFERLFKERK